MADQQITGWLHTTQASQHQWSSNHKQLGHSVTEQQYTKSAIQQQYLDSCTDFNWSIATDGCMNNMLNDYTQMSKYLNENEIEKQTNAN